MLVASCGAPDGPETPGVCAQPEAEGCEAFDIGPGAFDEDEPFVAWTGGDDVRFREGFQTFYMLYYRLQLSGDEIPLCPRHALEVWHCIGGNCGDREFVADRETAAETHADSGTTRASQTLVLLSAEIPAEGETIQLVSTVAGLARAVELTIGPTIVLR